jgi:hypothetical protein
MVSNYGIRPLVFVEKAYPSQSIKGEGVLIVNLIGIISKCKRFYRCYNHGEK